MKHIIEIDDANSTNKNLVALLKELSKSSGGIDFLDSEEQDISETVPFEVFAKELKASIRTKLQKKK